MSLWLRNLVAATALLCALGSSAQSAVPGWRRLFGRTRRPKTPAAQVQVRVPVTALHLERANPATARSDIATLDQALTTTIARMRTDRSVEWALLDSLDEVRAWARGLDGHTLDPATQTSLGALYRRMARALEPSLSTTILVRESNPDTAAQGLSTLRSVIASPGARFSWRTLGTVEREIAEAQLNLELARGTVVDLARLLDLSREDLAWLSRESGIELRPPTVADIDDSIDRAYIRLLEQGAAARRALGAEL
jgi:hypothetical protein